MDPVNLKTAEECRKSAAKILGVDEKDSVQFGDGDFYGFRSEKDPALRDMATDPRTGEEISFLCQ